MSLPQDAVQIVASQDTSNIVVDVRNATTTGTQLLEYTTDGTGPNLFAVFTYTGSAYTGSTYTFRSRAGWG